MKQEKSRIKNIIEKDYIEPIGKDENLLIDNAWISSMIEKANQQEKQSEINLKQTEDTLPLDDYSYENLRKTIESITNNEKDEVIKIRDKVFDVIFLDQTYERMKKEGKTVQEFLNHFKSNDPSLIKCQVFLAEQSPSSKLCKVGVAQTSLSFIGKFLTSKSMVILGSLLVASASTLLLSSVIGDIMFILNSILVIGFLHKFANKAFISANNLSYIGFFENKMNDLYDHIERIDERLAPFEKTQKLSDFADSGFEKFIEESTKITKLTINEKLTKEIYNS